MLEIISNEFKNWQSAYSIHHKMSERAYYKAQGVFLALAEMARVCNFCDLENEIDTYISALQRED